jgi:hypothetical protein
VEDLWEWLTYASVKCYICRVVRDPQLSKSIRIAVISPDSGDLISDLQPKSVISAKVSKLILAKAFSLIPI